MSIFRNWSSLVGGSLLSVPLKAGFNVFVSLLRIKLSDVVVVYHVTIVSIGHGLLKKCWPLVLGCVLRTYITYYLDVIDMYLYIRISLLKGWFGKKFISTDI